MSLKKIFIISVSLLFFNENVISEGIITSSNGDIYFNANGGNIISSNNFLLGNDTVLFKIKFNTKPYIEFNSNDPGVDGQLIFNKSGTKGRLLWQIHPNAGNNYVGTNYYTDAEKLFSFQFRNTTDPNYGGMGIIYNSDIGGIGFIHADTSHYVSIYTPTGSGQPQIGCEGCSSIYFRDKGGTWENVHAKSFITHSLEYNFGVKEAKEDIKDWVNNEHPTRLSVADEPNGTEISLAGKATAKIVLDLDNKMNELQQCKADLSQLEKRVSELEGKLSE